MKLYTKSKHTQNFRKSNDFSFLRKKSIHALVVLAVFSSTSLGTSWAQDSPESTSTTTPTTAPVTQPKPKPVVEDIDQGGPDDTAPANNEQNIQETVAQEKARKANKTLDEATMKLLDAQLAVDTTSLEIQQTRSTLADLNDKIAKNEALIEIQKLPLEQLSKIVKKRAVTLYMESSNKPSAEEDKMVREKRNILSLSAQKANVSVLTEFEVRQKRLERIERSLKSQRKEARMKADELTALATQFEEQLEVAKKEYEKNASSFLNAFGIVGARLAVDGKMCPIAGPMTHVNDWGNPRSGGRTHKGNDLFAATGTPNVAIVDGTIRHTSSPLGGMGIQLTADEDGTIYYYAHLSAYAGSPRKVKQGEVIGYVGDTGNARGGAPHTHFEIRVGGSQAVNPYPTLRIICGTF